MNPAEHSLPLRCHPSSVTKGRHFVRDVLSEWGLPRLADDAQLGTSELVANAVRHARTDLLLTVSRQPVVTIAIRDGEPQLQRRVTGEEATLAESGRGLHIVAAISQDWGIATGSDGKIIWFSLARPDDATTDADVLSMAGRRSGREDPSQRARAAEGVSVRSGLESVV